MSEQMVSVGHYGRHVDEMKAAGRQMKQTAIQAWPIGPFTRLTDKPVIQPAPGLVFECPMRGKVVRWAENHAFNPAAVVARDRIHVLFRAEDGRGDEIGQYTSRIGCAISADGFSFELLPQPVLFPADDAWIGHEWQGGCEDPRVIEDENGSYAMYYTMFNRDNPKGCPIRTVIGVATSADLITWEKHGPVFDSNSGVDRFHKAASVVQRIHDGRLVAARIGGKYWMYWGEDAVRLATSTDLVHWTPVLDAAGRIAKLITPRDGYFDSDLTEVGPPAVLTEHGITLIYNGKNSEKRGDPSLGAGAYAPGQALFDKDDPARLLERLDKPFMRPELDFERTGQYRQGTIFAEGLVILKGTWLLYYGTADTYVGVATAPFNS
jgi:beta-1,2-mannosidase